MEKTVSDRLKEYMDIYGLRQTDLLAKFRPYLRKENINIDKSLLNHYLSGKAKPKDNRLRLMAEALGVSEAWLAGYDVPMERTAPAMASPEERGMLYAELETDADLRDCVQKIHALPTPKREKVYSYVDGIHDSLDGASS